MRSFNIVAILIGVFVTAGCSHSTPQIVTDLGKLQIPVVQPSGVSTSLEHEKSTSIYLSNVKMIDKLTVLLKDKYLKDSHREDTFDVHSLSSKVYVSLTNLERLGLINAQYYNERNINGLVKINQTLRPFVEGDKSVR